MTATAVVTDADHGHRAVAARLAIVATVAPDGKDVVTARVVGRINVAEQDRARRVRPSGQAPERESAAEALAGIEVAVGRGAAGVRIASVANRHRRCRKSASH